MSRDGVGAVREITDRAAWDGAINTHGGHPMQLWAWGALKARGEWTPRRLQVELADGCGWAQVLVRRLPPPFRRLCYVPRGPVVGADGLGDATARVATLAAVVEWCRREVGGVGVTFEPDWPLGIELPGSPARPGPNTILYPETLIIDLTLPADELLKAMRKSTRYEIRRFERDGLEVRRLETAPEIRQVMAVYRETADRAGFGLHTDAYYFDLQREFGDASRLISAIDADGQPCCFAWSIVSRDTAFLLYGGSNEAGRKARATAAVYWAAMRDAADLGVRRFDLNGLLGEGITEFKKSFAKHTDTMVGTLDVPLNRARYVAWVRALPAGQQALRRLRGHQVAAS